MHAARSLNAALCLTLIGANSDGRPAAASSSEPLFHAIAAGNTAEIRRALDSGISARSIDGNGTPALMAATLFGDAAAMKLLLDRGADPNMTDKAGATALMWAIPELPKVKLLVAHGANVNARSPTLAGRRCWLPRVIPTRRMSCGCW